MFKNIKTAEQLSKEQNYREEASAILVATNTFNEGVAALVKGIPKSERESWPKQEYEARNILSDPNFPAPYLTRLAERRGKGETAAQLANKVMKNVAVYEESHADLLGDFQAEMKRIEEDYA